MGLILIKEPRRILFLRGVNLVKKSSANLVLDLSNIKGLSSPLDTVILSFSIFSFYFLFFCPIFLLHRQPLDTVCLQLNKLQEWQMQLQGV